MAGRCLAPSALFGQSLKRIFVLALGLVKELYVTEPVTDARGNVSACVRYYTPSSFGFRRVQGDLRRSGPMFGPRLANQLLRAPATSALKTRTLHHSTTPIRRYADTPTRFP